MLHFEEKHSLQKALYAIKAPADYDSIVGRLVPGYGEMHALVVSLAGSARGGLQRVLDLGVGTGQTAKAVLDAYPGSHLVGIDSSESVLEICRARLAKGYDGRFELHHVNMADYAPKGGSFNAVVGVLSVHHLDDVGKENLFKRLYGGLASGGVFVLGDVVTFPSPEETALMEGEWFAYLRGEFGAKGADYWLDKYRAEDSPSPVSSQLDWMRQVGFIDAACPWQHGNHAVLFARKP